MRDIPSGLQARLDSGVTTLCHCWKLTRRDGVVQGFTDHDDDLVIAGVTYRAGTGFTSSEATSRFDLSVDGAEIAGALSDDALLESDLAAGRYDAAGVESWLVDWSDVSLHVLTARSTLGEVSARGKRSARNCADWRINCRNKADACSPRDAVRILAMRSASLTLSLRSCRARAV